MKILPTTKLGKWAIALLVGNCLLFIFTSIVIVGIFKQEGGETFTDNLYISIPMFSAFILLVAALITAAISIWKYQERSLLVIVPIIFGLVMTLFIIGEFAAPH